MGYDQLCVIPCSPALAKFMGVNKFNLQLYAKTFQFLHNNSRHLDSYGKFMKILSVLIIATIFYIMSESFYMLPKEQRNFQQIP